MNQFTSAELIEPKTLFDPPIECNEKEYLYRYDSMQYAEDGFGFHRVDLILHKYRVIKTTRCGKWVTFSDYPTYANQYVDKKFVLLQNNGHPTTKRWACNTEKEALESFMARKHRQISILTHQLDVAKRSLAIAEEKEKDENLSKM